MKEIITEHHISTGVQFILSTDPEEEPYPFILEVITPTSHCRRQFGDRSDRDAAIDLIASVLSSEPMPIKCIYRS